MHTHTHTHTHTAADSAVSERETDSDRERERYDAVSIAPKNGSMASKNRGTDASTVDDTAAQEVCSLSRMCSHIECVRYMYTIV